MRYLYGNYFFENKIGKEVLMLEWFFDGIGTEIVSIIVSLIVGAIGGGAIGYKVGIKRTAAQKQGAGDDSEQRQELQIGTDKIKNDSSKSRTGLRQSQRAGNNAAQTQIGGIDGDRR